MDEPHALIFSIGLVGALLIGLWRLTRTQWGKAARQLGFSFDDNHMAGTIDGVPVRVTRRTVGIRHTETIISVAVTPPLNLGLTIGGNSVFRGGEKVYFGDAAFRRRFVVRADDAERARWLFTDDIRATMIEAAKGTYLSLDDESLELDYHAIPWAGRVVNNVRAAARLINLIQKQRKFLPVPTNLQGPKAEWAELAATHGLRFDVGAFKMHGQIGGFEVTCEAKRKATNSYTPRVTVRLRTNLGRGLRMVSRGCAPSDSYLAEHAIWVSHPELNSAFETASTQEDAAKRLLNKEVCDALIAMSNKGLVTVDDAYIRYETGAPIDAAMPMILDALKAATAFESALKESTMGDGYR